MGGGYSEKEWDKGGRVRRKERMEREDKVDRYCSYIIIKGIIVNLPELIHVVVQLCFFQYALHHGDQNSFVSERWGRRGDKEEEGEKGGRRGLMG